MEREEASPEHLAGTHWGPTGCLMGLPLNSLWVLSPTTCRKAPHILEEAGVGVALWLWPRDCKLAPGCVKLQHIWELWLLVLFQFSPLHHHFLFFENIFIYLSEGQNKRFSSSGSSHQMGAAARAGARLKSEARTSGSLPGGWQGTKYLAMVCYDAGALSESQLEVEPLARSAQL